MESIVIIGGGQAAAFAAQTLRKEGFEGTLSIISDEEKIFYERPPLSKSVLAGEESPEILSFFSQEAIEALNIDWLKRVLSQPLFVYRVFNLCFTLLTAPILYWKIMIYFENRLILFE